MEKITVPEAAKMMDVDPQFLRLALQQDKFDFGVAVKCERTYSYYINRIRFESYLQGRA
jgi:hypothetical protein